MQVGCRLKLRFSWWLAVLLTAVNSVAGETYYVSPQGDDALDGRTEAMAWRSVSRVNERRFAPGDVVMFQRGGIWRQALKPKSSGTLESPVTFTAYGRGEHPLFVGSDDVVATGLRIPLAAPVFSVMVDDAFLRTPGDYRLEGKLLLLTRPLDRGQALRLIRREDMVHLNHVDHVVVRGLAVDATAKMHAGYGFRVDGCRHIVLDDCVATRCGKHHFGVINSTDVILHRCHASLVMPDQGVGGASAFVSYSDRTRQADESRYEECTVERYADAGGGQYPAFVTHGEGIGSVVIIGFTSRGAPISLNNLDSGASLSLSDSLIEDADVALYGKGSLVKRVTLKRGVLTLAGEMNRVLSSSVVDCDPGFAGYQSAVVNVGKKNQLKDSTIMLAETAKPFNAAIALVDPESALTWENCRFGKTGAVVRVWFSDVKSANCMGRGNNYPPQARFLIKDREQPLSLAEWRAFGFDVAE
jgi:hypothetical protein